MDVFDDPIYYFRETRVELLLILVMELGPLLVKLENILLPFQPVYDSLFTLVDRLLSGLFMDLFSLSKLYFGLLTFCWLSILKKLLTKFYIQNTF